MTTDLDRATVEEAYAKWAPIYDVVFGAVFEPGRKVAMQAAEKIGGRILEFGVGTGVALPNYKRTNRLVGVDISEPMLQKARERVEKEKLSHVEGLCLMDGAQLGFGDDSFDVVIAQFVITVVPHPEETLDEMARVLRPAVRSFWSTISVPRKARVPRSSAGLRVAPASSVGARSSSSPACRAGPRPMARSKSCRPAMSGSACTPWCASAS